MTDREALKLALEYIETNAHERRHVRWAIKEALAQPPQEPVAKYSDIVSDGGLDPRNKFDLPPQRQWVGLTDEEKKDALISIDAETRRLPPGFKDFARAIEAKLKEKNT